MPPTGHVTCVAGECHEACPGTGAASGAGHGRVLSAWSWLAGVCFALPLDLACAGVQLVTDRGAGMIAGTVLNLGSA